VAGTTRCGDDVLYTCDDEGDEESAEECGPAGCNSDTLSCNPCAAGTARCAGDVLYTCEGEGNERAMECGELEFCGRERAACHPLVVAGFSDHFASGYIYLNNDADEVDELSGIKWTLDEAIELRRLGLFVLQPASPEASIITFFIFDDSNPTDPTAGALLHQQQMTVTHDGATSDGWAEVDADRPVVIGPGNIWLIIQASAGPRRPGLGRTGHRMVVPRRARELSAAQHLHQRGACHELGVKAAGEGKRQTPGCAGSARRAGRRRTSSGTPSLGRSVMSGSA
jgi:hypothetical protein